jgi:very-short-patch-repair endonuclease
MYSYNKNNKKYANTLRREMTEQESKLYFNFLVDLPQKFYKQKMVGNYILDFYCPECQLAIEIDGSQHYDPKAIEYDKKRTEYLKLHGIKVLRYDNIEIKRDFDWVCRDIFDHIN